MKSILQKIASIAFLLLALPTFAQENFKLIADYQFDYTNNFKNGFARVCNAEKWGIINSDGKVIIAPSYPLFYNDFATNGLLAVVKDGKWGYVDRTGKPAIDYQFWFANSFAPNGLAAVAKDGKWVFIDYTGKVVIDYQFQKVFDFESNGLAAVTQGGKIGFINQAGVLVADYQFDNIMRSANGFTAVMKGNKWGYINDSGVLAVDYLFDAALPFGSNGLAPVQKAGKYGYIDKTGKTVIDYQYDNTWGFVDGLAKVQNNGKIGFIDQAGRLVIDYQYKLFNINDFSQGLNCVSNGEKFGYIDKTGKLVIDYQFTNAKDFSDGLASVKKGDKYGYIDQAGNLFIDYQFDNAGKFVNGIATVKKGEKWGYIKLLSPIDYITKNINTEITKWQEKGKYETTAAYQARVTESNRKKKLEELSNIAVQNVAQNYCDWKTVTTEYDADNQTFKINAKGLPPFYVKVPVEEAESFDRSIASIQFQNLRYALGNDNKFFLQQAVIKNPDNGKAYSYSSADKAVFAYTQLNMNFEPINLTVKTAENAPVVTTNTKSVSVGLSEVDVNIPANSQTNDKTFAVIIANENYQKEVKVQYALNDGKVFRDYCEKTLGIPAKNIHYVQDASYGNMKSEIKWISDVITAFSGQAKVIFYYAGHGMPNEADKSAYLLPVDGFSSDFETAIKLDDLYAKLTDKPSQGVTVFLDACFSGSVRENGMLANARGVKIRPKAGALNGKMVVFSAASGDETAYPYAEKQHGLFTYFLLKKLQETKGNVDYQTLSTFITENVKQQSIVVNQKSQTPQVNASTEILSSWGNIKIK